MLQDTINADLRAKLASIESDIESAEKSTHLLKTIEQLAADEHNHESLIVRLNETLMHFGTEHPELVPPINQVLAILGTGGI